MLIEVWGIGWFINLILWISIDDDITWNECWHHSFTSLIAWPFYMIVHVKTIWTNYEVPERKVDVE